VDTSCYSQRHKLTKMSSVYWLLFSVAQVNQDVFCMLVAVLGGTS
jgi:hypothetical protein